MKTIKRSTTIATYLLVRTSGGIRCRSQVARQARSSGSWARSPQCPVPSCCRICSGLNVWHRRTQQNWGSTSQTAVYRQIWCLQGLNPWSCWSYWRLILRNFRGFCYKLWSIKLRTTIWLRIILQFDSLYLKFLLTSIVGIYQLKDLPLIKLKESL